VVIRYHERILNPEEFPMKRPLIVLDAAVFLSCFFVLPVSAEQDMYNFLTEKDSTLQKEPLNKE